MAAREEERADGTCLSAPPIEPIPLSWHSIFEVQPLHTQGENLEVQDSHLEVQDSVKNGVLKVQSLHGIVSFFEFCQEESSSETPAPVQEFATAKRPTTIPPFLRK
jgi:hypothetical protein